MENFSTERVGSGETNDRKTGGRAQANFAGGPVPSVPGLGNC